MIAWRVFSAPGSGAMARRAGNLLSNDRPGAQARQPTLEDLLPGDAISFWDGDDQVVESVVECHEDLGTRTTSWRWVVLGGGRVLETAPDGNVLYSGETVFHQGTVEFDTFVAEPDMGGALKTFEARVRDGLIARNPVLVDVADRSWTIESTGTFAVTYRGTPPRREVWRDISSTPSENVYFELKGPDGEIGLGLWTTHILLLEGRALEETDIHDLYPGGAGVVRP